MNLFRSRARRGTVLALVALGVLLVLGGSHAHAGGGCHQPVASGSEPVVHLVGACFTPTIVHVKEGTTVTWTTDPSGVPHTVTGANASWGSSGDVLPGTSFSQPFAAEGVYPYYCMLHPGMVGAVVVGDELAPESVSVGGAQRNQPVEAGVIRDRGSNAHVWLFVVLAVVVGVGAGAGCFVLGTRRARG